MRVPSISYLPGGGVKRPDSRTDFAVTVPFLCKVNSLTSVITVGDETLTILVFEALYATSYVPYTSVEQPVTKNSQATQQYKREQKLPNLLAILLVEILVHQFHDQLFLCKTSTLNTPLSIF